MRRPIRILSVAYPFMPVHAGSPGGAEQILYELDRAIVAAGHRSTVIAAEGSEIAGKLIPTRRFGQQGESIDFESAHQEHRACIQAALPVDLIHYHGLDFIGYAGAFGVPALTTLHLPVSWYPEQTWKLDSTTFVCVSESQQRDMSIPSHVIHNGVEISESPRPQREHSCFLWLGRICPEKGTHLALQAAHVAAVPLIVAGAVHPFAAHQQYFREQVEPLLDAEHTYLGEVSRSERNALLSRARAVLIPTLAPETSSLVAMEAMAAGVPLIAFRSGALPEIVRHGITGFLVDSVEEMAAAITRIDEISPEACRAEARERFSARRMTAQYLELYADLITCGTRTLIPKKDS